MQVAPVGGRPGRGDGAGGRGRSHLRAWHRLSQTGSQAGFHREPRPVSQNCGSQGQGAEASPVAATPARQAPHAGSPCCSRVGWAPPDIGGRGQCHHTRGCPRDGSPCRRRASHAAADSPLPWTLKGRVDAPSPASSCPAPHHCTFTLGRVRPVTPARRVTLFFACRGRGRR